MCGIVGFVSDNEKKVNVLINGLKTLEYRGYDSCGIAMMDKNNELVIYKAKGKIKNLEDAIDSSLMGKAGIGHTRWATHGEPTEENAHPHKVGNATLVHNGIIENAHELKIELEKKGYVFQTPTDTEVACALIDDLSKEIKDKKELIRKATKIIRGSYAFAIMFNDEKENVYAIRKDSPLILGTSNDGYYLASDVSAFLTYTDMVLELNEGELAVLKPTELKLYDENNSEIKRESKKTTLTLQDIQKDGYDTFLLKEINEQPSVIEKTLKKYVQNSLEDLNTTIPDLSKYDNMVFIGCGSAMHASMVAKTLMERYTRIPCKVEYASEFRYQDPILTKNTLCVFVSQSGETADTLAALKLCNSMGIDTLSVVNVIGSSLAKESKYTLYTLAGKEISVATTKAYSAQILVLTLLVIKKAMQMQKITKEDEKILLAQLQELPVSIKKYLPQANVEHFAKSMYNAQSIFFLGRGLDYSLSVEGSLKLKEISYINSQAYPAGELKHGTISLIEENTPVVTLITDEKLKEKTLSNMKEVQSRGARILLIIREDLYDESIESDELILLPKVRDLVQSIISVIPYQLLAYHIGKMKDVDIDQPRNLAKSVTVE